MPQLGNFLGGFVTVYTIAAAVLTFVIHTVFAFAVDRDARNLVRSGDVVVFVGPGLWAFATFLGGPLIAVAYWIVHHSNLRRDKTWPPNNGGAPH